MKGRRALASQAAKWAARLGSWLRPGHRRPVGPRLLDLLQGQGVRLDEQVGRRRVAVEPEREVVGREDLREGDRRRRAAGGRPDEGVVDPESQQLPVDVATEGVVGGAADQGGREAVPGRGHRDVGDAAAEELLEAVHLVEGDAVLQGIEVDPHPPHRDEVVAGHLVIRADCRCIVGPSVRPGRQRRLPGPALVGSSSHCTPPTRSRDRDRALTAGNGGCRPAITRS